MFGKNESTNVKFTTMLGPGSDLQGDFYAEGSARVDGNVNGNVKVTGMLILGPDGRISGNIEAEAVVLGGEVLGNVLAPERAELTATARVSGDVTTRIIVIDEHAVFQGRCSMNLPASDEGYSTDRQPASGKQVASGKQDAAGKQGVPGKQGVAHSQASSGREIKQKMMEVLRKDAEDGHSEERRQEGLQEVFLEQTKEDTEG